MTGGPQVNTFEKVQAAVTLLRDRMTDRQTPSENINCTGYETFEIFHNSFIRLIQLNVGLSQVIVS